MEAQAPIADDLLREQRVLAVRLARSDVVLLDEVHRLAQLAIAIDALLSNGGDLPKEWRP